MNWRIILNIREVLYNIYYIFLLIISLYLPWLDSLFIIGKFFLSLLKFALDFFNGHFFPFRGEGLRLIGSLFLIFSTISLFLLTTLNTSFTDFHALSFTWSCINLLMISCEGIILGFIFTFLN